MTSSNIRSNGQHVYFRELKEDERTSLSVLAGMIASGAQVLDLGCGSGALGRYLSSQKQCVVDGVTWNEKEAGLARAQHYRTVHVADLQRCELGMLFEGRRYDAIVCADVLEHLPRPQNVLAQCRDMLEEHGRLLISVPNVGYSGLVAELLSGDLRYREEGLLDATHLRFFTRRSLQRFLRDAGWDVHAMQTITRELSQSEFRLQFDSLPPAVARYLLAVPDALTYQFIVSAEPSAAVSQGSGNTPDDARFCPPVAEPAQALFTAMLYPAVDGAYDEQRKCVASGTIGQTGQTLHFELPAAESGRQYTQLRVDIADRPGFIHLHGIVLRDLQGGELWRWDCTAQQSLGTLMQAGHQQMIWQAPLPAGGAPMAFLYGDDPWMVLPLEAQTLEACTKGGARLALTLDWPMSADYVALSGTTQLALQTQENELRRQNEEKTGQIEELSSQVDGLHCQLDNALTNLDVLHRQYRAQEKSKQVYLAELRQQQDKVRELQGILTDIENSTVIRVTRPLVHTKMWIDKNIRGKKMPTAPVHVATPVEPTAYPVDVIVPVYRGLDETRCCVESVLAAPTKTLFRLVVVNDASPEPEVTQWLREKAHGEPRMVLLENEQNLGFVGTVNRAMAGSETNDVVLLNSDTEVANDWLDRIRRAAYSDARVATVTPFSNNATICSYPRFCKANELPDGVDVAALDQLFAQNNAAQVADIPTGVGFCMYIRRDSLREVGLFDVETFGKGYGEENDYCRRALAAGWRNLHALDTFVRHAGGVSFGDSKSQREMEAVEKLERLYPDYVGDVTCFVRKDPAKVARHRVDLARIVQSGLPVILAITHNRGGGTLRHVYELAEIMRGQAQFLLLLPMPGQQLSLQMADKTQAMDLRFDTDTQWQDLLDTLRALGVAHVHYHHLIGHDEERIRSLPAVLDVRHDCTVHDFYAYCLYITLTGKKDKYTGEDAQGLCNCCRSDDLDAASFQRLQARRGRAQSFLLQARHVLLPSMDAARRFAHFVPQADLRFAPHTDVNVEMLPPPRARVLLPGAPLKVAVIGALSTIKGADILESVAMQAVRSKAAVEFHLLGYGYRNLCTQPRAALTVHGKYEEDDLSGLLQWLQPDVVWLPALWPETYSYTLSACLQAGLPVVVPDIGAFAHRVQQRAWTWVRPWDETPQQWLDFFCDIRERHFVPAVAPVLPPGMEEDPLDMYIQPWSYGQDYLRGVTRRTVDFNLFTPEFLQGHLGSNSVAGLSGGMRGAVLRFLIKLRSVAGLRGLARLIPRHWQRKVKDHLLR